MNNFMVLISLVLLSGCGMHNSHVFFEPKDGISMGVDVSQIAPSCVTGGVTIKTFIDSNSNAILDLSEPIKQVSVICNGANGASVNVTQATTLQCLNGGLTLNGIPICNGTNGTMGPSGPQGPAGPQGSIGNMTPIQLCPGDTASYKEYGFVVGADLFAVYFDAGQSFAFMSKLSPGNYMTTDGGNCNFTYTNNGTTATVSNSNGTTSVPLNLH